MNTRLWLCDGLVGEHEAGPGGVEGLVSIQRVLVMPLGAVEADARAKFASYLEETYGPSVAEAVTPVSTLAGLVGGLLALDGTEEVQLDGVPADAMPTTLNVEVGYSDYSPHSQQTPSRLESVVFPCRALADLAAAAVSEAAGKLGDRGGLVNTFTDGCHSCVSDDPKAAVDLMEGMVEEMYGEDED